MEEKEVKKGPGKLTVIFGPMFAGKTEELIRQMRRFKYIPNKKGIVFKPKIDDRYSKNNVCSHNGTQIESATVDHRNPIEIFEYLTKDLSINVIGIDEIQFFDLSIEEIVDELIKKGYIIIASGLDKDFRGEPFGPMPRLLCKADERYSVTACCHVCGEPAQFTQRIIDGNPASYNDPIILVGATDAYEARCREHFIIKDKPEHTFETGYQYIKAKKDDNK